MMLQSYWIGCVVVKYLAVWLWSGQVEGARSFKVAFQHF